MIKLIVSDMDGTLLNSNHELPPDFWEVFDELKKKNVLFTIASGRCYSALKYVFEPRAEELNYICDNGAYVVEEKQLIHLSIIDKPLLHRLTGSCEDISDIKMLLCGVNGTYHLSWGEPYNEQLQKFYCQTQIVTELSEITDDIFKIAIFDIKGPQNNCYPILHDLYAQELSLLISGDNWADIMTKGTDKGSALKAIQKKLGISPDETMAFGDFYNDVAMLNSAKYSFVMGNANEDMKQHGNYIAKTNNDNGVMEAIKSFVLK